MEEKIEYLEEKLKELAEIVVEVAQASGNKNNINSQILKEFKNILSETEEKIKQIKIENKSLDERLLNIEKKLNFITKEN